jgi:hypothetical protein
LFTVIQSHAITRMRLSESFGLGYRQLPPVSKRYISHGFANMTIERNNVAKKLFADAEKITLTDLKQCQKQSTIDLEEHYHCYLKQHKCLETESDFIVQLRHHPKTQTIELTDGEELYHRGADATMGYFIVDGCVEFITPDGIGAIVKCSNFIGIEVLEGNRTYTMTCRGHAGSKHDSIHLKSESKENVVVRLLAITHEMIQMDFDSDICGMILKMSFKTQTTVQAAIEKMRAIAFKKEKRRASLSGRDTPSSALISPLMSTTACSPSGRHPKFFFPPVEEELTESAEIPGLLTPKARGASLGSSEGDVEGESTWHWSPEPPSECESGRSTAVADPPVISGPISLHDGASNSSDPSAPTAECCESKIPFPNAPSHS